VWSGTARGLGGHGLDARQGLCLAQNLDTDEGAHGEFIALRANRALVFAVVARVEHPSVTPSVVCEPMQLGDLNVAGVGWSVCVFVSDDAIAERVSVLAA